MWGEALKKKKILKRVAEWLDAVFLLPGMGFISAGVWQVYRPAGLIAIGVCFTALAFFIAKKQAGEKA